MGDFGYENDDYDDEQQSDGPADLRKAHRAATRKIKELESKISELSDTNAKLSKRVRSIDIVDLLPKGVSPKVAKLIPENVEATADAVKAWLDDFGDVFNVKAADDAANAEVEPDGDDNDSTASAPTLDEDTLAALSALSQVSSGGEAIPAGAAGALLSDVEANAKTQDDLIRIMAKHGLEVKSGY